MRSHPLAGALRNDVYEALGHRHQALLREVPLREARSSGPYVAATVLGLLNSEAASVAQANPAAFFKHWVAQHQGQMPASQRAGGIISAILGRDESGPTDGETLRWVGLAVIVAVWEGALLALPGRQQDQAPGPAPHSTPPKARVAAHGLVAIGLFSRNLRDLGSEPDVAGDLLARARYWWAGDSRRWGSVEATARLEPVADSPVADDGLVVVVYRTMPSRGGSPSSRPETASLLRAASRGGEVERIGTYIAREPDQLTAAGFRR